MRNPKISLMLGLCFLGSLPALGQIDGLGFLKTSQLPEVDRPLLAFNHFAPLQAQVKVGSLKFTPPHGWTSTNGASTGVLAFAPPDLPAGKTCQVRVFADEVSKETSNAWFTRKWDSLMSGKSQLRTSDVVTQKIDQVEVTMRSGAYQEGSGEAYALIIASSVQGHFVLVSYEANDFPLIEKHQNEVYAIFNTMELVTGGAPSTGDPEIANPPVGTSVEPTVGAKSTTSGGFKSGDPVQEDERIDRLGQIARLLQDPAQDTVALITEGARLCGFVIWNEDRAKIADPIGSPRLKLAITDVEVKEYAEMFRRGDTVVLDDLIGMLDVAFKGNGQEPSCGPLAKDWLENGVRSDNPSVRALTSFIQDLGAARGGGNSLVFMTGSETLDPVQSLLVMRVLTEEIGGALRKVIAKEKPPVLLASLEPAQEKEVNGTAEDAFVGGITGLWDSITGLVGKGEGYAGKVGKANAVLSIVKFVATYLMLKSEVHVDAPGQPLVRTLGSRPSDAGEYRKIIAKFWIDGSKVTDWMKNNRQIVALAGLDIDMPKTGVLKGVPTEWKVTQGTLSATQLIQTVRGSPSLSKVVTDEKGEATVGWEGCPQPVELDPKKVMPMEKRVPITVTPQVKEVTVQQDLVDAVTGAIGLKSGPIGFVTPLMEMLYRMKWTGGASMVLRVRDWRAGETLGQLEISIKATGHTFTSSSAYTININRNLVFTDVGMVVIGGEVPGLNIDPRVLEKMNDVQRKQIEEGMKQMAELAKRRDFIGEKPGSVQVSVNDAEWSRGADGCDLKEMTHSTKWTGSFIGEFADKSEKAAVNMFRISVDTDKKIVRVTGSSLLNVKYEQVSKGFQVNAHEEKTDRMSIFSGLELDPPFKADSIEFPLKETKVLETNATNYYGAITIPFKCGTANKYQGSIIMSYSVTRKATSPK